MLATLALDLDNSDKSSTALSSPTPARQSARISTASPVSESNEPDMVGNFPFDLNPREIFWIFSSISAECWNGNDCSSHCPNICRFSGSKAAESTHPWSDTVDVDSTDFFGYIDPDGDDFTFSSDFAFDDQGSTENAGLNARIEYELQNGMSFVSVTDHNSY